MIETTRADLKHLYERMEARLRLVRDRLQRPITLAEKILFGHLAHVQTKTLLPGVATLKLCPDRVILQDATAQMALLQFMQARLPQVKVPSSVHCDHLIQAYEGSLADTARAEVTNREVYDFLRSVCAKYGLGFWGPGSGIIHQVGYLPPPEDGSHVVVLIPEGSDRLRVLDPFEPMVESQFADIPVLLKTKGKTTTDQISPAGAWLRYRGHLDKISDNLLTGAINAWTGARGRTVNLYTGEPDVPVPVVARYYQAWQNAGSSWATRTTGKAPAASMPR